MIGTVLKTREIYDFQILPNPLSVGNQPLTRQTGYDSHYHPQVGLLEYHNTSLPHMHIMDLKWRVNETVFMVNDMEIDTINFNFQLEGRNDIRYRGLAYDMTVKKGEHYFVYNPEESYHQKVERGSNIDVLHISLDKTFFADTIGESCRWSENIQRKLAHNRAFTGINSAMQTTPRMWQLIDAIRFDKTDSPFRNLMIQSRALELIALQFEQLKAPSVMNTGLRADEMEKLHYLKMYLDANFLLDLNLTQLSRECALNEFKVKQGFRSLFGNSVFGYLQTKRMEHAGLLLVEYNQSVDEVADKLGYSYSQHFTTAFKRYYGISPTHYRRRKLGLA